MVTFDSPFERCPVCHNYVLLDSTQQECACEHGCAKNQICPLGRFFSGQQYKDGAVTRQGAADLPMHAAMKESGSASLYRVA